MTQDLMPRLAALTAVTLCLLCLGCAPRVASGPFKTFVHRDGGVLKDGDQEFRFISFNIPNLHYVEDDLGFEREMPFRLPVQSEIDDALATIDQVGGQVVRMYALSVRKPNDPESMPRHILGPGQFNEAAFVVLDQVLAAANRHRVRVIIPFIDQHSWWGGTAELAGFRGKKPAEFWTDPEVIADYQAIVRHVVGRVNTITGVPYREDKAILAWETGNELKSPDGWVRMAAAYIKSLDRNHLVLDGSDRPLVSEASLDDPNVDFVQTHHYDTDPRDMVARVLRNGKLAAGRKPYHVGEFGFLGTEALREVIDTVIREKFTGALIWSLRCRHKDGGFFWHHEPFGGDLFKAYHWPGFPISEAFDERRMVRLMRSKAYEIRGLQEPPMPAPAAPYLLNVTDGGLMSWRGSVGADRYSVQRAESLLGSWSTVATGISDAAVQYRPLFADESAEPGRAYYYRVVATNECGKSEPSNVFGPVTIAHRTMVDELRNNSRIFLTEGKPQFVQNDARKFKEDCHRLAGTKGCAVTYYVETGVQAARVYAFTMSPEPDLKLSYSRDGRKFEPLEAEAKRTVTYGQGEYDFWRADLYKVKLPEAGCGYLRIEFQHEAQLSRVEIDHG